MAHKENEQQEQVAPVAKPKCSALFARGMKNVKEFNENFAMLAADLADGAIDAARGNAICSAGRNILKATEMEMKSRGNPQVDPRPSLALIGS